MYLNHKNLSDYFVIDIEADSLTPSVIWCVVVRNAATNEVWRFRDAKEFNSFVALHKEAIWVGHNALSFDIPVLNRLWHSTIRYGRVIDTLVLSYLYHPKMPGGHSLEAYGERFGFAKDLFNDFSQFSPKLLARCEVDTELNLKVFLRLTEKMRAVGFSEKSCELEHQVREIIDRQQKRGYDFDVPNANILLAKLLHERDEYAEIVHKLFPPQLELHKTFKKAFKQDGTPTANYQRHNEEFPNLVLGDDGSYEVYTWNEFNIGSSGQRLDKLLSLGFVPNKLTKGGNPSVDEESLVEFAKESGIKEAQAIADWLVVSARSSMLHSWLNCVADDGAIHGRVFSCGAGSRRMTHSGPNTANIPGNEARYGHEVRSLWRARQGLVQVGYDAKSAQMRCFAHLLPDPSLGARFYDGSEDPHQTNADLIGIPRRPIKNVFYANMFGAFPPKLATTAGRSGTKRELTQYGTWIQAELYRVTPGLLEATEDARAEQRSSREGWMRCIDGGYVRCPSQHSALNYRIQPLEAVLMKQAMVFIDRRSNHLGQWKIADIHDEGQHETLPKDAEEFGKLTSRCLQDAGEELGFRVPMDGDFKIGKNWADCH